LRRLRSNRLQTRAVATPYGDGRLVLARAADPVATLLLSHGAGKGIDSADLVALADRLPSSGVSVALFEQPWVVAGRKVASPPATLDVGLRAAAAALVAAPPLFVGGRSAGARSAARCAFSLGAAGCLALSFPLHPPGRPEKSRLAELAAPSGAGVPTLVVQGERDTMGRPEEFPTDLAATELFVVADADHSLRMPARAALSTAEALEEIFVAVHAWILRTLVANQPGNQ